MNFNKYFSSFFSPVTAIVAVFLALATASCIEDGFTSSPANRPTFSTDTLDLGTVITTDVSNTRRFTVRNPHSKGLIISDISLEGANAGYFRLNVDGFSGERFSNVEIRANDSIYVLVSCTLPENKVDAPVNIDANIRFTTNGGTEHVVIRATGQDVNRLNALTVRESTTFSATKPYQVFDSLIVAEGATLTLPAGARLMFHDKAYMRVYGTLIANGSIDKPVELRGDRTGDVISGITFDLMAGQWYGLDFMPSSKGNKLTHTVVRNTVQGVIADGTDLELVNSRLRNSQYRALTAIGSDITAVGCEFAEAPYGTVSLTGGTSTFDHCTFPNYYLFSAVYEPAITLSHLNADNAEPDFEGSYTRAEFTNSIIYGLGNDIRPGNLDNTDVYLRNCLLKSEGTNDDHFIDCIWGKDPLYYTVREEYVFDYRLKPESPAIGAGNRSLSRHPAAATDPYGLTRGQSPDLGAYVFDQTLTEQGKNL